MRTTLPQTPRKQKPRAVYLSRSAHHRPGPTMPEHMPPEDDPIIRGLREAGIRPLRPIRTRRDSTAARSAILLIAIVLAFLVFLPFLAGRLADWLWYREIGFERVFLTKVVAQWALGVPTALLAFGALYANARLAMRGEPRPVRPPSAQMWARLEMRKAARVLMARGMEWLALPASAVL